MVNLAYSNLQASFSSQDEWKQIVDPVVQATCCKESLSIVISITNKCISTESWSRPSIEDVLWNLQYASQVQNNSWWGSQNLILPLHQWQSHFWVFCFNLPQNMSTVSVFHLLKYLKG